MNRATALSINWSQPKIYAGVSASRLLQRSTLEERKAVTAAFAAPIGNDLMQLLMRRTCSLQGAHNRKTVFSGLSRSLLEHIHSAIRYVLSFIRRCCCAIVNEGPARGGPKHRKKRKLRKQPSRCHAPQM